MTAIYLFKSSTKISFISALPAGPSSGYILDLLPLGFVTKATCTSDYFAVTPAHQVV